jgi:HNH endonuclease
VVTQARRAAVAANAFLRLVETGGKGKARSADLVIVCDLRAYRRGRARQGEPCHIVGGGPIPVSLARELGHDAFVKAVLHDGVRIDTIAHFGRKTPAVLRTALQLGIPPAFDGTVRSAQGCDRRYHLEQDHIDPVANGGKPTFPNLEPLCWVHHQIKTEQIAERGGSADRTVMTRPDGKRPLLAP